MRKRILASLMALCAGLGPMKFAYCILAAALFSASALCPKECAFSSLRSRFIFTIACAAAIIFIGMPSGGEFIYFKF